MARFVKEMVMVVALLLLVSGTTLLYLDSQTAPDINPPKKDLSHINKVAFIGDSVSWGINPDFGTMSFARYGWVQMLTGNASSSPTAPKTETLSTLWPGVEWKDLSLPGNTIWYYKDDSRLKEVLDYAPDLIFFMLGGNDVLNYLRDGELNATENAQLKANVELILSSLSSGLPNATIVVLNYYDLFDTCSGNITNQKDLQEYRDLSAVTAEANAMMRAAAERFGCLYFDIYSAFMHHCYGRYLGDGAAHDPAYVKTPLQGFNIHPNTKGHEAIYDTVYGELALLKAS